MSGSGKPATSSRKKVLAKPKAASLIRKDDKTFKSAEFVQDSDDDEEDGDEAHIGKSHTSTMKNHAFGLPAIKKKIQEKPTPSPPKPAQKPKAYTPSQVDGDSGSDGEASTGQLSSPDELKSNGLRIVEKNVAAKRLSSVARSSLKRKTPSISASDTESSKSDQHESSPVPAKRRRGSPRHKSGTNTPGKATLSAKPSRHIASSDTGIVGEPGSNEDAETDSASEGGSESQSQSGSSEKSTPASDKRTNAARKSTQPRLPYVPPLGFKSTSISSHAASSHTVLFSPTNLQGKQVWHITVPASVPLNSIQGVAKHSVQDGSTVLTYKGADYGLISEPENQGSISALLLPSVEDNVYRRAGPSITKTLHLRQLVRLPSISHDVGAEDAGTQVGGTINVRKAAERPAPEQPEGLKMRFKPIGVQDSDDSDSVVTPRRTHKPPEFRRPQAPLSSQSPKKRKHDDLGSIDIDGSSSPQKLAKLDATAKSVATTSSVTQTPQKKSSRENGSTADKGEGNRISSSKKPGSITEPRTIGESPTTAKVTKPDSITGDTATFKPTGLPETNELPSSSTVNKSSSPTKEAAKRKKNKQGNQVYDHSNAKSKPPANTIESVAKPPSNNIPTSAKPSSEPPINDAKKPRRKHKTVSTNEEIAQDDGAQATVGASQPGLSVVGNKPTARSSDLKPGPTSPNLPEHSRLSEKSSSQPTAARGDKASAPSKSKHEGETPEERKKRREEKKRRKEARANAKA